MRFVRRVIAGALLLVVAPPVPAVAATKTVRIPGRSFDPQTVTVFVGDTVRWVSDDNERHSVTASPGSVAQGEDFDSSPNCGPGFGLFNDCLQRGQTFSHTFASKGTFTYYCKRHGSTATYPDCGMCGVVFVVQRPAPTTPPATPPTTPPATTTSTASASPTASGVPAASGSPTVASPRAAPPSDTGPATTIVVAAIVVALLGGSGYLVYRTMIRR